MAKNKNTYEKRRKEMERKRKADEKRERRAMRRAHGNDPEAPAVPAEPAVGEPVVGEPAAAGLQDAPVPLQAP